MAPDRLWLQTNRAHALMLLDRANEARALYLKYRGQEAREGSPWEKEVLNDFRALQKAGIKNPLMTEIEKAFAKPPYQP